MPTLVTKGSSASVITRVPTDMARAESLIVLHGIREAADHLLEMSKADLTAKMNENIMSQLLVLKELHASIEKDMQYVELAIQVVQGRIMEGVFGGSPSDE